MPYGVAHRKHRKLLAQALHPRVVQKDFVPLEEKIIRTFETSLKDTPDEFTRHIKQCVINSGFFWPCRVY